MPYYSLSSSKFIRNIIIAIDVFTVMAIAIIITEMNFGSVFAPDALYVVTLVALALAEMRFHTILHLHHQSLDKVFARTTWLCFSFTLFLFAFFMLYKWFTTTKISDVHVISYLSIFSYIILLVSRFIESLFIKSVRSLGKNIRSVCFVGKPDRLKQIYEELDDNATTGLKNIGYYSQEEDEELTKKMPYLGNYSDLENIISTNSRITDELYCALKTKDRELSQHLIRYCMDHVIHFYYVPTYISDFGEYLKPTIIGDQVVFANFNEPLLDSTNRLTKRAFDIVFSGCALLVLLPIFPFIILCIEMESPGNPFFGQLRTGRDGKDFKMWKFRSMHINDEANTKQATKDDPRKFRFGNFMRKASIDELPQFWNVLVGDMSIVGPRPHMQKHTDEYSVLINNYMVRHYIRPGLTGWAQTNGFRGETSELWQMEGRVKRDIWYIQNWTFWLDIRIIIRTISQVIFKDDNAY